MGTRRALVARSGRLHHVALRVTRLEASVEFYSVLLGLPKMKSPSPPGRSAWLSAGGCVLMLERTLRGGGPKSGSGHLLAFAVSDLAAAERRLGEEGVAIEDRTAHTLYLRDPDGHRVALSTFRFPVAPILQTRGVKGSRRRRSRSNP